MMVGIPPFYHNNQMMMFQLIRKAEIRFPAQIMVSEEAKDLVKKVLKIIIFLVFHIFIKNQQNIISFYFSQNCLILACDKKR